MSQIDSFYQTVGFHFSVEFTGLGQNDQSVDARFQTVSGLDAEFQTETIKEGGENRFEHTIPTRRKYGPIVLKRGLLSPDSASVVTLWLKNAFDNLFFESLQPIQPIDMVVNLLNDQHQILMKWEVKHVWPTSWKVGELNAEQSAVLIETITLNCNYFTFKKP